MAEFIYEPDTVSVPADFITNKMTSINGEFVKIYLYTLYLATNHKECSFGEIARHFNILESDVIRALELFDEMGMISFSNDKIIFANNKTSENISKIIETVPKEENEIIYSSKSITDIKKSLTENKELSELCTIAEATYGKTMNDNELEILYWIYSELGLSSEVILMLIEYCISNSKNNMKYIQKVAITWSENGITTMEAAQNFMTDESEKKGYIYSLRKTFGILNRPLSESEEKYLSKWHTDYGMSEEMVELAYDYCIIQINKLSFQYMNTIIKNWYDKGIQTVAEAKEEKESFKNSIKSHKKEKKEEKPSAGEYDNLEIYTQNNFM